MKLREFAEKWGAEIGKDGRQLAIALLDAATRLGEFDELPATQRLIEINDNSLQIEPIGKGPLIDNLRKMVSRVNREKNQVIWDKDAFVWGVIKMGTFYVHRASIAVFAERRELPMPSWWAKEPEGITARPITVKALTKILMRVALAEEPLKESELRERVMADSEVTGKKVPRQIWRQAFRSLPDHVRRGRGQTDKAVAVGSTCDTPSNPRR